MFHACKQKQKKQIKENNLCSEWKQITVQWRYMDHWILMYVIGSHFCIAAMKKLAENTHDVRYVNNNNNMWTYIAHVSTN